ncbi:MAG: hypothetical protein AAGG46_08980, partial [Planctomycetota bacterium]
ADERSDIYSLGCTLYYLLTGRPPFPEGTISERLLKHQVEKPESVLSTRPDAPLSLVEICERMMSKKAEDRFQTAGDVATRLTEWLEGRGRKIGGGQIATSEEDSGIGSGIFTRFAVPPTAPKPGSSQAMSSPGRDTTNLSGPDTTPEEDLDLAPLEEEPPKPGSGLSDRSTVAKPPASSGVLSDDSHADRSTGSRSGKRGPKKSIFEEEAIAKEEPTSKAKKRQIKQQPAVAEFNPLHPPGYVSPYSRTPLWVWIVGGLVAVAVAVVVFQFVMR